MIHIHKNPPKSVVIRGVFHAQNLGPSWYDLRMTRHTNPIVPVPSTDNPMYDAYTANDADCPIHEMIITDPDMARSAVCTCETDIDPVETALRTMIHPFDR